ncbi:hypothetical protein [Cryptosporangium aurantiacum]|uniref:Uncharacterized protein n=1 Tax=Cryptosporangium aurantiacum TaxID=134849 RepID=A0A1M7N1A3_9ACTN|nr:hypothetical protein [Cryptosporangium aurantiacum]SHM97286.1 hypothetical protein SAMN05443668_102371 [Cryptosporangium aurantiacum]
MASQARQAKHSKNTVVKDGHLAVSEFLGEHQGPASPFGDIPLPLPTDSIDYVHPAGEHEGAHQH